MPKREPFGARLIREQQSRRPCQGAVVLGEPVNRAQAESLIKLIEMQAPALWADARHLFGDVATPYPPMIAAALEGFALHAKCSPELVSGWFLRLAKACRALK